MSGTEGKRKLEASELVALSGLALTVDAAINVDLEAFVSIGAEAGNSGGPVVDPLTGRMTLGSNCFRQSLGENGAKLSYYLLSLLSYYYVILYHLRLRPILRQFGPIHGANYHLYVNCPHSASFGTIPAR